MELCKILLQLLHAIIFTCTLKGSKLRASKIHLHLKPSCKSLVLDPWSNRWHSPCPHVNYHWIFTGHLYEINQIMCSLRVLVGWEVLCRRPNLILDEFLFLLLGSTGGGDADECYELVLREARTKLSWTKGFHLIF